MFYKFKSLESLALLIFLAGCSTSEVTSLRQSNQPSPSESLKPDLSYLESKKNASHEYRKIDRILFIQGIAFKSNTLKRI